MQLTEFKHAPGNGEYYFSSDTLERIGWCTADHWVHMQASYDLACERQRQVAALTIAQSSRNPAKN